MAEALDGRVRAVGGVGCRYGGEEFAVVAALADARHADALAEDILAAVRAINRAHAHSRAASRITLSLGLCIATRRGESPAVLLQNADRALYEAKAAGRDRWAVWRG